MVGRQFALLNRKLAVENFEFADAFEIGASSRLAVFHGARDGALALRRAGRSR